MSDSLQRESDVLGDEFGTPTGGSYATADIDFDRAASAFRDISLDGTDDFSAPAPPTKAAGMFSFDGFSSPTPTRTTVTVTGDDEIEKFESEFPDIEGPQAPQPPTQQPLLGQTPTFAPQPAYSSTPTRGHHKQAAELKARDEVTKAKRQETIGKAEYGIDQFYEEYALKKERNIRENKETEGKFLADLSASLSQGTVPHRSASAVRSSSKTRRARLSNARSGTNTTDLTRFKEVLHWLKRERNATPTYSVAHLIWTSGLSVWRNLPPPTTRNSQRWAGDQGFGFLVVGLPAMH
ncbi:clathrin light chain [Ganoderma leucocontextum]|nr:clathrin light chain [Ganoderma leucocontextum]